MICDVEPTRPAVLLLENEPILTMLLSDYIEEAGCEVVDAQATAEAIRILEARSDIRVVVADLDVRGSIMGMKLMALIRERWPPIELILTSSDPRRPRDDEMPTRGLYFDKPFDGPGLVSAIRRFSTGLRAPTP